MPRVLMMCGPSGSGKSTYARGLEADGMVRLTFDAEVWRRGYTSAEPVPQEILNNIEADLKSRLLELVDAGRDVVLDFSFSTRQLRDEYRRLLAPTGIAPETVYFAVQRDTVIARVKARSNQHADDLALTEEVTRAHFDGFEVPTDDEGPLTVVRP